MGTANYFVTNHSGTMAIMMTLIKGQEKEAAVGIHRISSLGLGEEEPCRDHMCCDMAGFPKCQGKSDRLCSQHIQQSQCKPSTLEEESMLEFG